MTPNPVTNSPIPAEKSGSAKEMLAFAGKRLYLNKWTVTQSNGTVSAALPVSSLTDPLIQSLFY
jgi:hypothetical protein